MPDAVAVLRKQTHEFIAENSLTITLQRPDLVSDGAGGFDNVPVSVDPQTFRMIERNSAQSPVRTTVDGREVTADFVLLGEYDADIEPDDWYMVNGIRYEIVYVRLRNDYEKWAEVNYRG